MRTIAVALAALGLLASAAEAGSAVQYRGKTRAGTSVTFGLSGRTISGLLTSVPVTCLETSGTYKSRAGIEIARPPAFALGRTVKASALQPSVMDNGIKVTKRYTIRTAGSPGGQITGTLRVSFSFLRPGADPYHSLIYVCTGTTTFTAGP